MARGRALSRVTKGLGSLATFVVCGAVICVVACFLHLWITKGGQSLQGGTGEITLAIIFRDSIRGNRVGVDNIRFRNVDPSLPVTIHVHQRLQDGNNSSKPGKADTTLNNVQVDLVKIPGDNVDSLAIETAYMGHSVVIDDLRFDRSGKEYKIDFDRDPKHNPMDQNSQLSRYVSDDVVVHFRANNAVPTVTKGKDLIERIGQHISGFNGPLSTGLVVILLMIPFWLVLQFSVAKGKELSLEEVCSKQDARIIERVGMKLFPSGKFCPQGDGYGLQEDTELHKIFASLGKQTASDPTRLVEYLTERIHIYFNEIEDRLSETFGMAGILALSLGLLGTVIGMIDAFHIIEHTIITEQGPIQTQLKMAHYINFALITTALGFSARILSIVLVHLAKSDLVKNRYRMVRLIEHFNPAINGK